jgi:hypothetical protein
LAVPEGPCFWGEASSVIRAYVYLLVAGVVWCGEGLVFGRQLDLRTWQIVLLAVIYVGLYAVVVRVFFRSLRDHQPGGEYPAWRVVSLAPMLAALVGSFVSLPLLLAVVALGKVV